MENHVHIYFGDKEAFFIRLVRTKLVVPLSHSNALLAELREGLLKSDNDLVNLHHNSYIRRESKNLAIEMQL